MTELGSNATRPPFVLHRRFLETPFERRFQGLLRQVIDDNNIGPSPK